MPQWVHTLLHWLSLHWGDVVPAWLAVILAAVFGILAVKASRRSKAALGAVAALERSATADETQAKLAQDKADAAERFPWRVDRRGGQDFRLVNLTNTRKYNVAVTGEPAGRPPGVFRPGGAGGNRFDVIDGRGTVELDLFVALQTQDRSVTVNWHPTPGHTGEPWTQRVGL